MGRPAQGRLGLLSLVIGGFVFFGGTSQWRANERYVSFLLPSHKLRMSIVPAPDSGTVALAWFNTSLGDVSYDAIDARGWTRRGDDLVLEKSSENSLQWKGRTGERVHLVLRGDTPGTQVRVTWDGDEETLKFAEGQIHYERAFAVPFYASRSLILLTGLLTFCVLTFGMLLVAEQRRLWSVTTIGPAFAKFDRPLDRGDAAIVLASMGLALLLRSVKLDNVFPAVDEYYHLIAAEQIIKGAALGSVYPRGLWVVTLPISLALRIFGHQLWAARLVGALFNVAAIVPLYLLARKINRPVAGLACLLYASSPWIVTFARVAREYAYYPFYFYWILYAMILFVSGIPPGCVVARDWQRLLRPRMLLLAGFLFLPPVFALRIDWLSTFRTVLIAYLVLGAFILGRFDWRVRTNWPIVAAVGAGVILSGRAWYGEQSDKILALPRFNPVPIQYFLPNPQQQWYFDRLVILIALGIAAAVVASIVLRSFNFVPLFMVALLASYVGVFAFLSQTYFHTRHLLTTQLWYVVVVALALYAVWRGLTWLVGRRGKVPGMLIAMLLGVCVLNVPQILLPSVSTSPDMPISEDYLHDLTQVQHFMLNRAQPNDVLVSTVYGLYATWEGTPQFQDLFRITSRTAAQEIFAIVDQYPSGWIVIDKIRLDLSSLSPRDFAARGQIEYIGILGDEYVWRWPRASAQAGTHLKLDDLQ
jgi:hypothetical protein